MTKSAHTPHYEKILAELIAMRKKAGLTQRELAKKLNREYSFVWRIETGERRLDLVEFFWVCNACGVDPAKTYNRLVSAFKDCE